MYALELFVHNKRFHSLRKLSRFIIATNFMVMDVFFHIIKFITIVRSIFYNYSGGIVLF